MNRGRSTPPARDLDRDCTAELDVFPAIHLPMPPRPTRSFGLTSRDMAERGEKRH